MLALLSIGCPQPADQQTAGAEIPRPTERPPAPPPPPLGTVTPGLVDIDKPPPIAADQTYAPDALCPGCDVVMISICSLRADHLGSYGDTRGLTPSIDALAKKSTRFTSAYAGANFTLGSLSTMLSGDFGSTTGVLNWGRGLPSRFRTLPEVLGLFGYRTGGFSVDAATGFRPDYGLDKGFQRMLIIDPPRDTPDGRHRDEPIGTGGATGDPMAEWLIAQPKDRPVFAMLHTRSAHFPFVNSTEGMNDDATGVRKALWNEGAGRRAQTEGRAMPGKAGGQRQPGLVLVGELTIQRTVRNAGAKGVSEWKQAYAESVARMDKDVDVVLRAVETRGKKTVVVLLADHGETLNDNGELLHGAGFFESVAHIPLIIHIPGQQGGQTIDALISQADLLPTITDLVGASSPEGIDGLSAVPLIRGTASTIRSTVLVEGDPSWTGTGVLPGAVISPPWALLRQTFLCAPGEQYARPPPPPGATLGEPLLNTCLFHLGEDPAQHTNLAKQHPEVVDGLTDRWNGFRHARAGQNVPRDLRLDPAMIEMLQRTGYDFHSGAP
jgi:arylsulfatase A-like enzyme